MSAIASFVLLPQDVLPTLRSAASPTNLLSARGKTVAHYRWSGYVMVTLLPYLAQRRQVDLMKSEEHELAVELCRKMRSTYFIFTNTQKEKYLSLLAIDLFSKDELRDYFNHFNGARESDMIGEAMLDGVRALHQSLASLDANSVIVFSVG